MNTSATGASAKQSGFKAHAAQRNSAAAARTAAHACASVSRPAGSSRARVRGFFASRSRSAIRLNPSADRKSTRLNSSHANISYAVFCLKKKKSEQKQARQHNDEQ